MNILSQNDTFVILLMYNKKTNNFFVAGCSYFHSKFQPYLHSSTGISKLNLNILLAHSWMNNRSWLDIGILLWQHDNVMATLMKLKMTHLIIFIAFLSDNLPKNWNFVLIKSPLQKFNSKISNITNLEMNPHIFGHTVVGDVYSFEEIMWKISQKL